MIFNFTDSTTFYFYHDSVDMRKGIHSLYHLVQKQGKMDALNGDAYIFISKSRKSMKILRWQKEGFILYHKKLELGLYTLPTMHGDNVFYKITGPVINKIATLIKHRSNSNELRRKVLLTLQLSK